MTFFLFAGDMLVMLFMVCLAVWVSLSSSKNVFEEAAQIPLNDEARDG
jgi:cbb3-type cytochrome oxidase subunit 3